MKCNLIVAAGLMAASLGLRLTSAAEAQEASAAVRAPSPVAGWGPALVSFARMHPASLEALGLGELLAADPARVDLVGGPMIAQLARSAVSPADFANAAPTAQQRLLATSLAAAKTETASQAQSAIAAVSRAQAENDVRALAAAQRRLHELARFHSVYLDLHTRAKCAQASNQAIRQLEAWRRRRVTDDLEAEASALVDVNARHMGASVRAADVFAPQRQATIARLEKPVPVSEREGLLHPSRARAPLISRLRRPAVGLAGLLVSGSAYAAGPAVQVAASASGGLPWFAYLAMTAFGLLAGSLGFRRNHANYELLGYDPRSLGQRIFAALLRAAGAAGVMYLDLTALYHIDVPDPALMLGLAIGLLAAGFAADVPFGGPGG